MYNNYIQQKIVIAYPCPRYLHLASYRYPMGLCNGKHSTEPMAMKRFWPIWVDNTYESCRNSGHQNGSHRYHSTSWQTPYCNTINGANLWTHINTFSQRQNGRNFADDIFKCIFLNENVWFPINISLKFVAKCLIDNFSALVQIIAWCRPVDTPLSETMIVSLPKHICSCTSTLSEIQQVVTLKQDVFCYFIRMDDQQQQHKTGLQHKAY